MTTEREEALELAREAGAMPDALSGHYIATEDVLIRIVRLAKQRGAEERKQLESELYAANARIAELEKDAARYRWLREHSTQPAEPWSTHSNPESLDDAIDAALRGILG